MLIGGGRGDIIDGQAGDDLIFGDSVRLTRRPADTTTLRFQELSGTLIYAYPGGLGSPAGTPAGTLLADGTPLAYRDSGGTLPNWAQFEVAELWHTATIEAGNGPSSPAHSSFGNDYIAGGAGDDVIFGQLGDDTIQGDGSVAALIDADPLTIPAGAWRSGQTLENPIGDLTLNPSFEAATDGDDYVEGGGGGDVIFGNLGQDDLLGGSSDFFGLDTAAKRPDGGDMIFGGAGTRAGRNDYSLDLASRHATDADVIVADNGEIVRLLELRRRGARLQLRPARRPGRRLRPAADLRARRHPARLQPRRPLV